MSVVMEERRHAETGPAPAGGGGLAREEAPGLGATALEHLVVYPRGGLCNRLRVIGSGKRLAERIGARCTIVWDWGDYEAVFDDGTDWVPYSAAMDWREGRIIPGYHHIRHLHHHEGGTPKNRRAPVSGHRGIVVTSHYVFCGTDEPPLHDRRGTEAKVLAWMPRPNPTILEKVDAFRAACFPPRTVGVHIRRTDNKRAIARSPDSAYFRACDRALARGGSLFLATDNQGSLETMHERYGDRLIHYPKASSLDRRWPRTTSEHEEIVDDVVDLWLLASCDYVIGSRMSSYSRVAILLNGSTRCRALDRPVGHLRDGVTWIRQHYF